MNADSLTFAILVGAFVGAVVLLAGLACGTWAVKRAWRALGGPCGASDAPDAAPDPQDAPKPAESPSRRSPTWSQT